MLRLSFVTLWARWPEKWPGRWDWALVCSLTRVLAVGESGFLVVRGWDRWVLVGVFYVCWRLTRLFWTTFPWSWRRSGRSWLLSFLIPRARIFSIRISRIYGNLAVVGLFLSMQNQHCPLDCLSAYHLPRCCPATPLLSSSSDYPPTSPRPPYLQDGFSFYPWPPPYLFSDLFLSTYLPEMADLLWSAGRQFWWDLWRQLQTRYAWIPIVWRSFQPCLWWWFSWFRSSCCGRSFRRGWPTGNPASRILLTPSCFQKLKNYNCLVKSHPVFAFAYGGLNQVIWGEYQESHCHDGTHADFEVLDGWFALA